MRDAVRRRVDELEEYPSDRTIQKWLEREKRIKMISKDTFPAVQFDEETEEPTTVEEATWSVLSRTCDVPVWVLGGLQSEPIKVTCSALRHHVSDINDQLLLEGPGYLTGVSSGRQPVDTIFEADGIQLEKQISRESLSRGGLINTVIGMGGIVELAVNDMPPFQKMVTGWDQQ